MVTLLTGTLRDAATLTADGVKHDMDVPALLRAAAQEIDELRKRDAAEDERMPYCEYGYVRCGKCRARLAIYEWCDDCRTPSDDA